ncbi:MAG: TRAP transporter small permease subunit [Deferribacteres bacterium]|nr:TRAP transporter small permease subunit [candidate division KSB1 bacterium]MCB9503428.1 TRAP transporter small permease subunit [Deferribacteres bacterium]
MRFLKKLSTKIDWLNEKIGSGISWLNLLLIAVVCYDVFTRYFLKKSSIAVQEMEWHIFAVIFLLGAAYTLKHDRHVRVDALYNSFSLRTQAWVDFLGSLLFLLPFVVLVIWASTTFVANSFSIGETSPDPGGLPARYLLKACIPLAFVLLLLQGLSMNFRAALILWENGGEHDA